VSNLDQPMAAALNLVVEQDLFLQGLQIVAVLFLYQKF
jgi:hypothetical protein